MKIIRYDEIRVGDVVRFYGANVKVVAVREWPAPANEYYPEEKTINFDVVPAEDGDTEHDAIQLLGKFYSHGTYGGVGCLTIGLVRREGE